MAQSRQNWFSAGGDAYARYRPGYPSVLADFLAEVAPNNCLALDVGCGNGQFTRELGNCFAEVIGSDPSADQIAHTVPHLRVRYEVGSAEHLSAKNKSASLITAAQAAHWFDLARFYQEVNRASVSGGVIALISYGVPQLEPELSDRFRRFYYDEIGPYWPPERKLVESGYADIPFPFLELSAPPLNIVRNWPAAGFFGYVSTWSAVRHAHKTGDDQKMDAFIRDISRSWGDPAQKRQIVWPINMRLGVVEG